MPKHLTRAELEAGLPAIAASPADHGVLEAIVIRPSPGERHELTSAEISFAGGLHGDRWVHDGWRATPDAAPEPDMQICMMNSRCIALLAQERDNWPPAGDNLFVDLDLSHANLQAGQRLAIGAAVIEITAVPHAGCDQFIARYGRDAAVFVNTGEGKEMRLRGIYARVVQDGRITVGDRIVKQA